MSKLFFLVFFAVINSAAPAQNWGKYFADTSLFDVDTLTITGKKYIGFFNGKNYLMLNAKGDTLIKLKDDFMYSEFKDINNDGYTDVILHHSGNTPLVLELLLYVPALRRFRQVKNFSDFPDPVKIKGTKYYYSYHKSGCADLNWDSDLFYIENFRAIRIGNISGIGCGNTEEHKDGIYIHKSVAGKSDFLKCFHCKPSATMKSLNGALLKNTGQKIINYSFRLNHKSIF